MTELNAEIVVENETEGVTAVENDTAATTAKPDPYANLRGKTLEPEAVEALIEKLIAANGEAGSYRHQLKELKTAQETEQEKATREATEAAVADAVSKYTPILIRKDARLALKDAGAIGNVDTLLKLLDMDKLTVDDEGEVQGLDKEIARVKKDVPSLFTEDGKPGTVVKAVVKADGGVKTTTAPAKSAAQQHADRILGRD